MGIFDGGRENPGLDAQGQVVSPEIGEDLGEDPLVRVSTRAPHPKGCHVHTCCIVSSGVKLRRRGRRVVC
jgi:hypothetical protein